MTASNLIHLTGNVGNTIRTAVLNSGTHATEFDLATNDYYRDSRGERIQRTEWHRVKSYGKVAESLAKHLRTGSKITVVGTMRYRRWEDKFEQKRTAAEVYLDTFNFVGSKPAASAEAPTEKELAVVDA